MITLPILEIETDNDTIIPVWNLILDDGKNQVFFQGFPQEVKVDNKDALQYVLVTEPHNAEIAKHNWTVESTTVGQRYLTKCAEASRMVHRFLTFRSDSDFCRIVQPGKKEDGTKILNRISDGKYDVINYLDNFRKNDKFGCPMTYDYNKYGTFSPSTLQKVNTLYELFNYFGDMKDWRIIEFGGSYGGLCHILSYMLTWAKYTFVEIKEPLELAKKCFSNIPSDKRFKSKQLDSHLKDKEYISTILSKVECITPDECNKEENWDLFISEFSICQLNEKGIEQNLFMLKNSNNAYLSMNIFDKYKKDNIKNKLLNECGFKTIDEYPLFITSVWGEYIWICKK